MRPLPPSRLHRARPFNRPLVVASVALALARLAPPAGSPVRAQVRPIYSRGAAGLLQLLQRLQTTASALHTAAHPDDEDTAFIARLARGTAARVAYFALNRGEGGQNVIGPELFEALGVIRTEELLQARTLDGGDQFFARTFDFGFSKSLDEAAAKWGEQAVLGDLVRVIRQYRPLVVYSGFSGTPADGHGQHQLAGKLAAIAFKAAADPTQCPEQLAEGLRPWQAKKLYVRQGFRFDPSNPPSTRIDTGQFDPLLGRTYFEIAMEGRSQHRSQEMGVPELRGPQASGLRLVESLVPTGATETSVFEGIDTSIKALPALAGLPERALAREVGAIDAAVARALAEFKPEEPGRVVAPLVAGLAALRGARAGLARTGGTPAAIADADFLLEIKERDFVSALQRAAVIEVDPLADTETVAPGESAGVTVRLFLPVQGPVTITAVRLRAPEGWRVAAGEAKEPPSANPMARFFREQPTRAESFVVAVPESATLTQPYWLERPRDGYLFAWPTDDRRMRPFAPDSLVAEVDAEIGGAAVTLREPVRFRLVDPVRGELRRRVDVVPALSVSLDSPLEIMPLSTVGQPHRVAVRLQSNARHPLDGTLRVVVPDGWSVKPAEASFALPQKGDRTAIEFTIASGTAVAPGRYALRAEATVGGQRYGQAMRTIAYPHIQTHRLYAPADAQVRVLDLKVAPVKVGYLMGSGDQVPEAIRRMGLSVTLLEPDDLAAGDLARFDVIVVGIRASEARPDFVANHGRLMAFVQQGGTLIVQYQQPDYLQRGLPPFPGEGASRVTVETAPVRLLAPDHPAFTTPNRIAADDWDGWVQERDLYAFAKFDPRYTPLLETADPGEAPQQGGELYAEIGKGRYVYTSYAWFRQLPAGVPGAYRLFANLLSLGKPPAR